ncbi:MAG: hypothetical protein J0L97_06205 [Alphaproteobacteria bacterium]|nr:hypothetical protein [Alphaproteobacteria bacterium]
MGDVSITPYYIYFLYTQEGKLLALNEFPQKKSGFVQGYILESLGVPPAAAGGTASYEGKFFADQNFRLKNDKIYAFYKARFPFTGEVETEDGRNFTGKVSYAEGVLSWNYAKKACELSFRRDAEQTPSGGISIHADPSGYYYLCQYGYTKGTSREHWFYRVNLVPEGELKAVLVAKREYYR